MSDNNKSDNQEHLSDPSLIPNEYLADMRKKKGIEERDAADALKISVVRLRSIEAGDFTAFPSETYVRGHLRNYSRYLNVDEDVVVKAYDRANPPSFDFVNPENNSKENKSSSASSSKRSWMFLIIMVILVALWAAAYSFFENSATGFDSLFSSSDSQSLPIEESAAQSKTAEIIESPEVDEASITLEDEVVADDAALDSTGNVDEAANLTVNELVEDSSIEGSDISVDGVDASSERDQSVNAINENSSEITSEQEPAIIPLSDISSEPNIVVSKVTAAEIVKSIKSADASVAVEDVPPDAHVLTFSFTNPCWVKVTDVAGSIVFAGLKASGSTLRLSGNAPFNIVLGNVDGTTLAYNDEPVILGAQTNGRPLRLVVGS